MTSITYSPRMLVRLRHPQAFQCAVTAGAVWGLSMAATLITLGAYQCDGVICLDEAIWIADISLATGFIAIGPIAAWGRSATD